MQLEAILIPELTCCNLEATSQKRALQEVAKRVAREFPDLKANQVFENLVSREKKGSTAIGQGIAIPHCRMKECSKIIGGLFKLSQPIDFNALDGEGVSILFVLLVPESETNAHLEILATLAKLVESEENVKGLLAASTDTELYNLAVSQSE